MDRYISYHKSIWKYWSTLTFEHGPLILISVWIILHFNTYKQSCSIFLTTLLLFYSVDMPTTLLRISKSPSHVTVWCLAPPQKCVIVNSPCQSNPTTQTLMMTTTFHWWMKWGLAQWCPEKAIWTSWRRNTLDGSRNGWYVKDYKLTSPQ